MEPLSGVLDEKFFLRASPECLQALASLIDDKLAQRFQAYLEQADEDSPVKSRMEVYMGKAIKRALFSVELDKLGYAELISSLDLYHVAFAQLSTLSDLYTVLLYLEENFEYIKTTTNIRTRSMFEKFYESLPMGKIRLPNGREHTYAAVVSANKSAFYQHRETQRRSYAASAICNKRTIWTIARKGIEYRNYCAKQGFGVFSPEVVRF